MFLIFGILIVFSCVFGGFILGNGQLLALWQPHEIIIIVGAAGGSFVVSNSPRVVLNTIVDLFKLLFGQNYNRAYYVDLFLLLYKLGTKIRRNGLLSVDVDIEDPMSSTLFRQHPIHP